MNVLDSIFGAAYDPLMRGVERAGLGAQRQALLRDLGGHVVDIGAGTGANLPHVGEHVERITALEPSPPMARRLRERVAAVDPGAQIEVLEAPAEAIPLADDTADAVVSTLVLCTVEDPQQALAEIGRVLRPGGVLVLIEHVAGVGRLAAVQRVIEPLWKVAARGCHLTRDTVASAARAGFDVGGLVPWRLPGGGPAAPAVVGIARWPGDGG